MRIERLIRAIAGMLLLAVGTAHAADPLARADVQTLITAALDPEFVRDRDVLVDLVEIPPDTTLDRHWHPGEEFQYYLEGELTVEIEGKPPYQARPGTVGHIPYRAMHNVRSGPSGAKVLVFRVHTRGHPTRHPETESRPENGDAHR